jgi:hypothetical protein
VGVEQHLHFVLQAPEGAQLGSGGQPSIDIAAQYPIQRGGGLRQGLALGQPAQRLLLVDVYAVLFKTSPLGL